MGVTPAIDDFGTGYSRFTYLRRFPVDAPKLSQSFVQDITEDPGDAAIVSARMSIGSSLNRRLIAEGLETREQFMFFKSHKCGEGQANCFNLPVVADRAGQLIEGIHF
jgi:EAL domain-containing protein (putative c-di-GMP-specific phosphodiesterase class I)